MHKHIPSVRAFLLLLLGLCLSSAVRADDTNVTLSKVNRGNLVYLIVNLTQCSEATVTFTATLTNMTSSVPLPRTVELTGPKSTVVAIFAPIDPNAPTSSKGTFTWEYGRRLTSAAIPYNYHLPYHDGPYKVIQGAHGAFSHNLGSPDAEAIDFAMPIGTKVYAARPGTVIGIRFDCTLGGPDKKWMEDTNYVIIKHDDGTMAEYLHLLHNGVLVSVGDRVTLDRPIALSGVTGYTTQPHLHFAVFMLVEGTNSQSLPAYFQASNGGIFTPREGAYY